MECMIKTTIFIDSKVNEAGQSQAEQNKNRQEKANMTLLPSKLFPYNKHSDTDGYHGKNQKGECAL